MSDPQIAPPRIGTGTKQIVIGGLLLLFGLWATVAAAGGSSSGMTAAILSLPLATCFLLAGFWMGLFGKLEQRLIDVQSALRSAPPPATSAPARYRDDPNFGAF